MQEIYSTMNIFFIWESLPSCFRLQLEILKSAQSDGNNCSEGTFQANSQIYLAYTPPKYLTSKTKILKIEILATSNTEASTEFCAKVCQSKIKVLTKG